MILRELCERLEQIAPPRLATDWDNVGLLVGDASAQVRRALLTVDLTDAVLAEAIEAFGRDAPESDDSTIPGGVVICYHPPIFQPLRRLREDDAGPGGRVHRAIRHGIALYALHTALDAAAGGTNDVLADILGIADARPLTPATTEGGYKLVTFVPGESADAVADALFDAGAGRIGDYRKCSFRLAGTGTFQGGEQTRPAIGQPGRFARAEEVRLEVVVPRGSGARVMGALRRAHPYEEVAIDLYPLTGLDERIGAGRIGRLESPAPLPELIERIKRGLGVPGVWLAKPQAEGDIRVAACAAGSCGGLYRDAIAAGAQLYLTGELRHHDALAASEAGLHVVAVGHSNSERPALRMLAERLRTLCPELSVSLSERDADPFRWA